MVIYSDFEETAFETILRYLTACECKILAVFPQKFAVELFTNNYLLLKLRRNKKCIEILLLKLYKNYYIRNYLLLAEPELSVLPCP